MTSTQILFMVIALVNAFAAIGFARMYLMARHKLNMALERLECSHRELDNITRGSHLHRASVLEIAGESCFIVLRRCDDREIIIGRYPYVTDDLYDREYKRLHAIEVADKLNEMP